MITVAVTAAGRVRCRAVFELPVPASIAWGQLRDFRLFAAQDFFHAAVRVDPGGVRRGARLEIDHRFGPFAVTRVGRIVQWDEGHGYAFSDLAYPDFRTAFPHLYRYRLRPAAASRCVIEITITGRWTARAVPRWLVMLWLRWVFSHIARSVHNTLLHLTSAARPAPALVPAATNSPAAANPPIGLSVRIPFDELSG
jgi:hypothetical protein